MVHESAHAIESLLVSLCPDYSRAYERSEAWSSCTEAIKIVTAAIQEVSATEYGLGKTNDELITAISRYAAKNASDTMAEAFADVFANGEEANPLSIRIRDLTIQQYEKYIKGDVSQ